MNVMDKFAAFWARPFNEDGDVWDWALLTIFVVTVAILWSRVLKSVMEI